MLKSLTLRRVEIDEVDWEELDSFPGGTIFQSAPWLRFLEATQRAEPVIGRLAAGGDCVGYFTGLIVKRLGIRVLGSPLAGWTTGYMGFTLSPTVSRLSAARTLRDFAFGELGCAHVELMDRGLTEADARQLGYRWRPFQTWQTDLRVDEATLFGRMHRMVRKNTRRAAREGVTVEEARDQAFAKDYYGLLVEVFGEQGLAPTYGIERVHALVDAFAGSPALLRLRALGRDGQCIAASLSVGNSSLAYLWGTASARAHLDLRANQALHWYAMRHWQSRGAAAFDWGGGGDYKRLYGGDVITVPWMRQSASPLLEYLRSAAMARARIGQRLGRLTMRHR